MSVRVSCKVDRARGETPELGAFWEGKIHGDSQIKHRGLTFFGTNTILGVPSYNYSRRYPQNPILMIKALASAGERPRHEGSEHRA